MLLDDDVVTDGKPKPGSFAGWLGREEWIEHFFLHVRRNAGAIVADRDFDAIAEVFGGGCQGWFVAAIRLRKTLRCGIEAVGNEVEQGAGNLLREDVSLASRRIK